MLPSLVIFVLDWNLLCLIAFFMLSKGVHCLDTNLINISVIYPLFYEVGLAELSQGLLKSNITRI